MFKIGLNTRKPYNYAFFCPVSKLHLTVSNPVGFVHEVTPAISRGLKRGTLIDIDGVINSSMEKPDETEQEQTESTQDEPEQPPEDTQEPPVIDNTGKKKRGRRASVAASTEDIPNDLFDGIK